MGGRDNGIKGEGALEWKGERRGRGYRRGRGQKGDVMPEGAWSDMKWGVARRGAVTWPPEGRGQAGSWAWLTIGGVASSPSPPPARQPKAAALGAAQLQLMGGTGGRFRILFPPPQDPPRGDPKAGGAPRGGRLWGRAPPAQPQRIGALRLQQCYGVLSPPRQHRKDPPRHSCSHQCLPQPLGGANGGGRGQQHDGIAQGQ